MGIRKVYAVVCPSLVTSSKDNPGHAGSILCHTNSRPGNGVVNIHYYDTLAEAEFLKEKMLSSYHHKPDNLFKIAVIAWDENNEDPL